jgi:L-alanine-DL-glutamate epimerase-like enolase superfamily enzyme
MKIAKVEAFRMYPKVIKEAWVDDEYVWPSQPPSFLIKITAENGDYGVGEATSQVWYLGETAAHIEACVALYDRALQGQDPHNFALVHRLMEAQMSGGMPGGAGRDPVSIWRSTISSGRPSASRSTACSAGRTEPSSRC